MSTEVISTQDEAEICLFQMIVANMITVVKGHPFRLFKFAEVPDHTL